MDWIEIICGLGLFFGGIIVGYPLGHFFGRREILQEFGFEPKPVRRARRNLEKKDVLFAEYLEVRDER